MTEGDPVDARKLPCTDDELRRDHDNYDDDDDDGGHSSSSHTSAFSAVAKTPPANSRTPNRVRFPSKSDQLARSYSAPATDNTDVGAIEKAISGPGEDSITRDHKHDGLVTSVKRFCNDMVQAWGAAPQPERSEGQMGIDMANIEKVQREMAKNKRKSHKRVPSLVAASTMLARPSLSRSGSAATINKVPSGASTGNTSATTSGPTTPRTRRKLFGSGIDRHTLARKLRDLAKRADSHPDQAHSLEEMAKLGHCRSLVLKIVRT